jgi:hypothetical protein
MNLHGFLDISDYRVHLPRNLYPYRGSNVIEIRLASEVGPLNADWTRIDELKDFFQPAFAARNPFNLPGPFYGAETDTCLTGPYEAPKNVLIDRNGQEFVFKQPANREELRQVIGAAICECFVGYGADGDDHWNLTLIREWWQTRNDLLAFKRELDLLVQEHELKTDPNEWERFVTAEAADYLRVYAFFVEEGRIPSDSDVLPEIR